MTLPHWIDNVSDGAETDQHFHNYETAFGVAAVPTATHFADQNRIASFVGTSGNNAFGAAVNVIGPDDTPVRAGMKYFDTREWSIIDVSNANPFIFMVIWGTPLQNEAAAEAAGQFSTCIVHQPTAAGQNKPQEIRLIRVPSKSQIWVKVKNAANLATVNFQVTLHEYPSPTP